VAIKFFGDMLFKVKSWIRNQIKWHISPRLSKFKNLILRKRVKIKILGSDNNVNLQFTKIKSNIFIQGNLNKIEVDSQSKINQIKIEIQGNSNSVVIEKNVSIEGLSVYFTGDGCRLYIGPGSYIAGAVFILAESNTQIQIGDGCMLAGGIEIRTGDSHGIFDIESKTRINLGKNVAIRNYVWIANGATILKGARIPNGSIIGSKTLVSNELIYENAVYIGNPARVVKRNVAWSWDLNRFPNHRF
jgi:acetyltransferase-like isoleucine patch superfamily enzyme